MQSLVESCQEGGAASYNDGVVKCLSNVNVTLLDGIDNHLVDTWPLKANLVRTEQNFRSLELF